MRQIRPEINAFLLAMAGATVLMIGMGYGRFAFTDPAGDVKRSDPDAASGESGRLR